MVTRCIISFVIVKLIVTTPNKKSKWESNKREIAFPFNQNYPLTEHIAFPSVLEIVLPLMVW